MHQVLAHEHAHELLQAGQLGQGTIVREPEFTRQDIGDEEGWKYLLDEVLRRVVDDLLLRATLPFKVQGLVALDYALPNALRIDSLRTVLVLLRRRRRRVVLLPDQVQHLLQAFLKGESAHVQTGPEQPD